MTTPATTGDCPTCGATHGNECVSTTSGKPTGRPHAARTSDNPNPPGRPTKLTPKVTKRICKALRNGTSLTTAAQAAGIAPRTLHTWLNQADLDTPEAEPFRQFRHRLLRARAQGAERLAGKIVKAGDRKIKSREPLLNPVTGYQLRDEDGNPLERIVYEDDWKAHAFILERSWASEWGKRSTVEVTHQDPGVAALMAAGAGSEVESSAVADRLFHALREARERDQARRALAAGVVEGEVVEASPPDPSV